MTLFAGALGFDATYQQGANPPFPIRVMKASPDELLDISGVPVSQKTYAFEVLQSAVAQPQKGDVLTLVDTGEVFKIKTFRCPDADRLLWRVFP